MIKKTLNSFFAWMMLLLAVGHMGTIRRDEDPILKSQTDSIALKQKLEETKDGVKGAPTPSFKYYEKEDFLARSPMKSAQEEVPSKSKPQNDLEVITEVQTETAVQEEEKAPEQEEHVTAAVTPGQDEKKEEDDWWMEDEAQDSDKK